MNRCPSLSWRARLIKRKRRPHLHEGARLWGREMGVDPVPRSRRDGVMGREYVRGVQRARLLTAALDVVGEHGWEGMSVVRVTRRAGVSSRTFYKVFAGREECFLAVFDGAVERLRLLEVETRQLGAELLHVDGRRHRAGLNAPMRRRQLERQPVADPLSVRRIRK